MTAEPCLRVKYCALSLTRTVELLATPLTRDRTLANGWSNSGTTDSACDVLVTECDRCRTVFEVGMVNLHRRSAIKVLGLIRSMLHTLRSE